MAKQPFHSGLQPGATCLLCVGEDRLNAEVLSVSARTLEVRPTQGVPEFSNLATALLVFKTNGYTQCYFAYVEARPDDLTDTLIVTRASNLEAKQMRRHLRVPCGLEGTLTDAERSETFSAQIEDLSQGGAAVIIERFLPTGRAVWVNATLPSGKPLRAHGYIVHTLVSDEDDSYRYGVRFNEVQGESESALLWYLRVRLREVLPRR